ncbi:ABC transporter permease, partial [Helicobacter pylori]
VSILTVFIVGFAVALQGALQLQDMGAPLMSVEMTAKLALREIGPFILTLVVAGRSASSFTAQIGVMKITEELDAMKT